MPLIHIQTSTPAPADPAPLLRELSRELASLLGKPERYVMVLLNGSVPMCFAGEASPCCYVEVKSIGQLDGDQPRRISAAICGLLERRLSLPGARTYIEFVDVPPRLWGWDGGTFAS
jgi:phenylpyruvate tautomerase PptA (4-oxalocrotonate tautomerase family)